MRRTNLTSISRWVVVAVLLTLPVSARAGDFSLDLLAGQAVQEGTDRHDGLYAVGLDYHAPRGVVVAGRVFYAELERGAYANGFTVAVEKHFGHSAFSPYVTAGAGPVILNLPDVQTTRVIPCDSESECGCVPTVKHGSVSGDDSYMAYSFGGGFDWKYLTAELAYVRPMEDGFDDAIRALVGVRLPVGK